MDSVEELIVSRVRCRPKPQDIAPEVAQYAVNPQARAAVFGARRADGEKPSSALVGHRLHSSDHRVDVECFELRLDEPHLVAADLTQPLWCQPLRHVKVEDRGGPIV